MPPGAGVSICCYVHASFDAYFWPGFFTTVIAAGIVITVLLFAAIPEKEEKKQTTFKSVLKKLDIVGAFLFAPSCVMLLLAIYYGGSSTYPWNSSHVVGLLCGSGGSLVAFIVWARFKGEDAMIPLAFFQSRIFVMSCLTGFLQFGANMVMAFYLAFYFQVCCGLRHL